MEKDVIFKGAGVAIATPFYENGNGINYDELARLIDFNLNNGTDAIIIAGTSGESATMTDEEHEEIIKFTVDYVNKRVPVIAGTGSNDTRYAINLSQHADKAGADALLVVTPYYNKCTQKGLIKHFTSIADNVQKIKKLVAISVKLLKQCLFAVINSLSILVMMTKSFHYYL